MGAMPAMAEAVLLPLLREPTRLAALPLAGWDGLLRQARASNLIGRLALAAPDGTPAPVQPHLLAARRLVEHQRHAIRWECKHLSEALDGLRLPVVLLKGGAYALADQPAARGRLFGDIDLLVPRSMLGPVEAALMARGWTSGGTEAYDQRYYRQWMHELPPMVNHRRGTVVDVHHNLLPLTARRVPLAERLLADSLPIADTPFRRLGACDQVLHCATHLFHEGELRNGLRDLFDLQALLQEHSAAQPDFWPALAARAQLHGLEWPLLLGLRYCERLLGQTVPTGLQEELQAQAGWSSARLAWMDGLYLGLLQAPLPSQWQWREHLAAATLYLRAHALRMPPWLLARHLARKAVLRVFKHSSRAP